MLDGSYAISDRGVGVGVGGGGGIMFYCSVLCAVKKDSIL